MQSKKKHKTDIELIMKFTYQNKTDFEIIEYERKTMAFKLLISEKKTVLVRVIIRTPPYVFDDMHFMYF